MIADVVGLRPRDATVGTVACMDDTGAMRAIAQLALAAETGGDVEEAVQAALMAEVEPYEVAELSGVPSQASGEEAVPEPDRAFEPARRVCELLPSA